MHRGRILKPNASNHDGYLLVVLCNSIFPELRQTRFVHELVLTTFVGPRPSKKHECRHLNGDPRDNQLENLAWGTRKQNAQDRIAHGTHPAGENSSNAKLTWQDVAAIRQAEGPRGLNNKLAEHYGVSNVTISLIRTGKSWLREPTNNPLTN